MVCSPAVSAVGKAAAARAWREANPERVEAYNEARRVPRRRWTNEVQPSSQATDAGELLEMRGEKEARRWLTAGEAA